jgi:hypothetical protein
MRLQTRIHPIVSALDQVGEFTTGTGSVKPFGRVTIVTEGNFSSSITGTAFETVGNDQSPPASLEGPTTGVINLANAKGRAVGSIEVQGRTWGKFTYQVRKSAIEAIPGSPVAFHGRVVASGTGRLTFPQGDPSLSSSEPAIAAPFTITL